MEEVEGNVLAARYLLEELVLADVPVRPVSLGEVLGPANGRA